MSWDPVNRVARKTIRCFYSCADCGINRRTVTVAERDPAKLDVKQWMDRVLVMAIIVDHRAHSPRCHPKVITEIGVPSDEGTRVGVNPPVLS